MRYELRTTFQVAMGVLTPGSAVDPPDKVVRWLYEYLPTKATLGSDLARPRWLGTRYNEEPVTFELITCYRNVFAATADRLRIADAVRKLPTSIAAAVTSVDFTIRRIFGDADLVDWADPTKPKITWP